MTRVKRFDRATVRKVSQEFEAVVQAWATKLGLKAGSAGARFSDGNCKLTIELAVTDAAGVVQTREVATFKTSAAMFGLKADDLGVEFRESGTAYKIAGIRPTAPKYPILAERIKDGKEFCFPADRVLRALGRDVPDWMTGVRPIGERETPPEFA